MDCEPKIHLSALTLEFNKIVISSLGKRETFKSIETCVHCTMYNVHIWFRVLGGNVTLIDPFPHSLVLQCLGGKCS